MMSTKTRSICLVCLFFCFVKPGEALLPAGIVGDQEQSLARL